MSEDKKERALRTILKIAQTLEHREDGNWGRLVAIGILAYRTLDDTAGPDNQGWWNYDRA